MPQPPNQGIQDNLATVRAMFAAVAARGDPTQAAERWAAYVSRYDENAVIHEAPSLPYGGEYTGISGIAAHAQGYGAAWGPVQDSALQDLEPIFIAENDQVIVLWRQRGLNAQSGEQFDMPATSVYKMKNGRVLESRMFHFDVSSVRDFLHRAQANNERT